MTTNTIDTNPLTIERVFNAPRASVWTAFSDPAELEKWWGPKGFTSPVCKTDFRVGGRYHFCMRTPDGIDLWSTGEYKEIVPMERIHCTDSFSDAEGNVVPGTAHGLGDDWPDVLDVIFTFEEVGDQTNFTLRHMGMPEGEIVTQCRQSWNEIFDKLQAALAADTD